MSTWLLLLFLMAYGCAGSARQRTLTASLATLSAADAALTAYDEPHQERLVETATSREDAIAKVTAWRKVRNEIRALIVSGLELVIELSESDSKPLDPLRRLAATVRKRLKEAGAAGVTP